MVERAEPAVLATAWRGTAPEAVIRGHIAVVDAGGRLCGAAGDPASVTTLRSAIKPVQALPFAAAAAALGATAEELAVACGSHEGEPGHIAVVSGLLARVGLDEAALTCGTHLPYSPAESARLIAAGEPPRAVHNNCSGKHAGMLAACVANGWPTAGYARRDHPLQQAIEAGLAALSGCDTAAAPWGLDGCGLATLGLPLDGLARAFARGLGDERFRLCQAAMAAHPAMVGGTGRFDTALLEAAGDRLTAKSGAAAVWVGVGRPAGPAVAIKLEAGSGEHLPLIACAVMERLGLLAPPLSEGLARFASPVVRNRAGDAAGEIRVELPAGLATG